MKTLFPTTVKEWCAKKRQFMRLLNQTDDPKMAKDYENAINFCDRGIAGVKPKAYKRVKYAVVGIIIAVILAIVALSGCNVARESCHLVGAACQDIGWTATKLGDNITTQEK